VREGERGTLQICAGIARGFSSELASVLLDFGLTVERDQEEAGR